MIPYTTIPHHLDGIIWTAVRSMMQDVRDLIPINIDRVKLLSTLMSPREKEHQAWDIRQNIRWWRHDIPDFKEVKSLWIDLADWLEAEPVNPPSKLELPGEPLSPFWATIVDYSLRYIIHRRTYASSYADDIAKIYPLMTEEQRGSIDKYLKENIREDDDLSCRLLSAFFDPGNRYEVSIKAPEGNRLMRLPVECFLFDGKYYPVVEYLNRGEYASRLNSCAISSISPPPA